MNKEKFAKEVLNVGIRQFHHVLAGRRGLSYMKAKEADKRLGGGLDLWIGQHSSGVRGFRWNLFERGNK